MAIVTLLPRRQHEQLISRLFKELRIKDIRYVGWADNWQFADIADHERFDVAFKRSLGGTLDRAVCARGGAELHQRLMATAIELGYQLSQQGAPEVVASIAVFCHFHRLAEAQLCECEGQFTGTMCHSVDIDIDHSIDINLLPIRIVDEGGRLVLYVLEMPSPMDT